MTQGAFHQQKRTSPTALAVVVLMHGAALTALALAKGDVFEKPAIPPTTIDFIEEKKDPPPVPPEPIEKSVPPPKSVITHVRPEIPVPPRPVFVDTSPLPPLPRMVIPEPGPAPVPKLNPPAQPAPKKIAPARARANLASYVSDEDYPSDAVRREEQGTTRFRLFVGANGRVSDCTVTGSSGSGSLDSATCRLMKQRAKFTPARDSDGRPTTDSLSSAIRWVLPE